MAEADSPAARFGLRAAAARAARGWSMRDVCARAGLPEMPSAVKRIEEGAGNGVALNIAAAVAHALGLSLDGLVDPCARCGDSPPAGFACTACGAVGKEPAS